MLQKMVSVTGQQIEEKLEKNSTSEEKKEEVEQKVRKREESKQERKLRIGERNGGRSHNSRKVNSLESKS